MIVRQKSPSSFIQYSKLSSLPIDNDLLSIDRMIPHPPLNDSFPSVCSRRRVVSSSALLSFVPERHAFKPTAASAGPFSFSDTTAQQPLTEALNSSAAPPPPLLLPSIWLAGSGGFVTHFVWRTERLITRFTPRSPLLCAELLLMEPPIKLYSSSSVGSQRAKC